MIVAKMLAGLKLGEKNKTKKGVNLAKSKYFVKRQCYMCKPAPLPAALGTITQPALVLYTPEIIIRKHAEHV